MVPTPYPKCVRMIECSIPPWHNEWLISHFSFLISYCIARVSTVHVSCPIPLLSFISFTIRIRYFDFYGARLSEKDMPRIAARLNMEKYVPRDAMSLCDTGVEKAL